MKDEPEESLGYDNSEKPLPDPKHDLNSETNTLWRKHVGFSPQSAADAYELCGKLERERDRYRDALQRIARIDYRGNRSAESSIAYDALKS